MTLATGHPVRHFDRIDSTNLEARRLAEEGERGPLWLVADQQTLGRGRLGRSWVSEPGNLYATFLFAIAADPQAAAEVSFVAALAVHDAAVALRPGLSPRIKWPNDVLIGGAKFCGVLPEVVGGSPTRIAIGCGVNIAHAPQGTPYPVTSLGAGLAVASVLAELDASLARRLAQWDEGRGFAAIRAAWAAHALGLGGKVTAMAGAKQLTGTFTGLAADGALMLQEADGTLTPIHSGEVSFAELEALRRKHA
ncbi:biotin--[acetyl-CoA-carboxylase] ligase [Aestuariivirga sp.]|uniref:biotin--[acetyl-CoA-carboxylase] ligase n=1 Tax=Aestuariivirga sp. TaxID=2650926 RepID=UPI0025C58B2A|nr:biotin--[acetyl-CoA-carboxylase] ligase [Aestuariivirga sp.]MCA3554218.1 biotin--[acetyl-CoA-carboxylase] ligase [Aestuariivirga sp.]